jgi:hypothetical protein
VSQHLIFSPANSQRLNYLRSVKCGDEFVLAVPLGSLLEGIAAKPAAPGSILVLLDKLDDQVAELSWLFQVHQMAHAG